MVSNILLYMIKYSPIAQADEMKLNHCPRRRNGTISVTMISVSVIIPPPPMPWIDLPTSMTVKLFATAATIAPMPKSTKLSHTIGSLPKMLLKEPRTGWKTVLVNRKDVPLQKASIAVPLSNFAMIGRATERDVASSATINVTVVSDRKARMKRHPGWNCSVVSAEGDSSE